MCHLQVWCWIILFVFFNLVSMNMTGIHYELMVALVQLHL